jgi:hypothetical protein
LGRAEKRFALSEDRLRIRASQGHSLEVELEYQPQAPPEYLYHGTAARFVDSIRREGLQRMQRHDVHLSAETTMTMQVGQNLFPIVVSTQDWHPADHGSFAANHPGKHPFDQIDLNGLPQTLWPVHCVQGTHGAELGPGLKRERIVQVSQKGTDAGVDSYSGFFDNGHRRGTGLEEWLRANGAREIFVCGLATDY